MALLCGMAHGQDPVPPQTAASYLFRPLMDYGAYAKAMGDLPAKRIDPSAVASSPFPTWGVIVLRVTPGSQAAAAGMVNGTVIESVNEKEYYHRKLGMDPDANGKRHIWAVDPTGVQHEYNFKPGLLGNSSVNGPRPEQYVFQNSPRGEWDRDMLVAAVAFEAGDHPLAETALQRATAAGMPPRRDSVRHFTHVIATSAACEIGILLKASSPWSSPSSSSVLTSSS